MNRRFKSSTFKFNQPLSSPESKQVYYCYGVHGKGYGGSPPFNTRVRILYLSNIGEVTLAERFYCAVHRFTSDDPKKLGDARLGDG